MVDVDVLVVCEAGRGQTESVNPSLVAEATKLAVSRGGRVVALLVGHDIAESAGELSRYVDEVFVADSLRCANYDPSVHLEAALKLVAEIAPGAVLLGHTHIGMDLAHRLALKLRAAVATNCFEVRLDGDAVYFMRPMYRGRMHAKVAIGSRPQIATLQQNGRAQPTARDRGKVTAIEIDGGGDDRARPLRTIDPQSSGIEIAKADIVVSGGRGIGEKGNYALVEELASALNGVPACSRPLVDMGWLTSSHQVGLSGTTVKPKLYVACGISGAAEHVQGMKESGTIVAINKDPEAPIFKIADYGIVGDLVEIVPLVSEETRSAKAGNQRSDRK